MFDFFTKRKQDEIKQNTLGNDGKDKVDIFVRFATATTDARRRIFDDLISFVLESNQWSKSELKEKNNEEDRALIFNFSEEYVTRYMARLFPRNPQTGIMDLGVKVYETDHAKKEKYENEIFEAYRNFDITSILLEQGLNYLTAGAAVLYYPQGQITRRAEIMSLDPRNCYLGWHSGQLVQFAYREYAGENEYSYFYWDLENYITKNPAGELKVFKNDFNFIPVSWIPNFPKPHCHEGNPKTNLLYDLDREYNNQSSNFAKRTAENTSPHIVVLSDSVEAKDIKRGKSNTTRLGSADDMKYLKLEDGKEILDWLDRIERRIKSKTGLVTSNGDVKSGISGKSLSFQYSDMMDLIGFMRIFWDKGIRDMNRAILTYKYGVNDYHTDPVYQPFLQQDNSERINQYVTLLENDLITHLDAIDELRGVENAEEKLKEIIIEKQSFNKLNNNQKNEQGTNNDV